MLLPVFYTYNDIPIFGKACSSSELVSSSSDVPSSSEGQCKCKYSLDTLRYFVVSNLSCVGLSVAYVLVNWAVNTGDTHCSLFRCMGQVGQISIQQENMTR